MRREADSRIGRFGEETAVLLLVSILYCTVTNDSNPQTDVPIVELCPSGVIDVLIIVYLYRLLTDCVKTPLLSLRFATRALASFLGSPFQLLWLYPTDETAAT